MAMENLKELYFEELQDLYSVETQLLEALEEMAEKATSDELEKAFNSHLEETREQRSRLEQIFARHDFQPDDEVCEGIKGIIEEGKEMIAEIDEGDTRDAAMIGAAQRAEHYEIAAYGTARTFAQHLDQSEDAELLEETLEEESATDEKLTTIAEGTANPRAEQ